MYIKKICNDATILMRNTWEAKGSDPAGLKSAVVSGKVQALMDTNLSCRYQRDIVVGLCLNHG